VGSEVCYSEIERILDSHEYWYILSHIKPDGDTLGSACALYAAGIERGKRVSWGGASHVPISYKFLPFIENYKKSGWIDLENYKDEAPLFICVDTSTLDRTVGGLHGLWKIINIDHHADNMKYGTYYHIEPEASSTSEVIWSFMKSQDWEISKVIAVGLYTGLMTDTGNFSFNNTRTITHHAAADLLARGIDSNFISLAVLGNRTIEGMHIWGIAMAKMRLVGDRKQIGFSYLTLDDFRCTGANHGETEFLVNQLLFIHGVEIAILLIEEVLNVRISFRSIKGGVSAGKMARKLGGGGHELAAGATSDKPISEVIPMILDMIEEEYDKWDSVTEQT